MKERRRREGLFFLWGSSAIGSIEFVESAACDLRLNEATVLSDFLLDDFMTAGDGFCSACVVDFLMKGRPVDSLSARGRLTACTNSLTEELAFSFSRAVQYYAKLLLLVPSGCSLIKKLSDDSMINMLVIVDDSYLDSNQ